MSLSYRMRGKSDYHGKPKVFFCCHPQDFGIYFDELAKELLEKQNCSVWYEDGGTSDEDIRDDLAMMQLFVVPVTTRLLTKQNRAMSEYVPFAIEHHIPVLPLMLEEGLEELYNKKFQDLQYLDRVSRDPTAIPYDEKLTKYLASVLVGDELAEKVRAAFDAYIFLSYRKRDRKHARELMQLIHQNDLCQEIAIWYDEFLTPGEDFNHAIAAALEKCDLFALMVTPNLVNEINYVMTTEYPAARAANKPVVPAQVVPTARAELEARFEELPPCVDGLDAAALASALLSNIRHVVHEEHSADPKHDFFIGLAYLGGIDVEVDHQRARKLITSAAENGLPEAVEKLVEMYRTGNGVERDYHAAIDWQEKLVELRKKAWEESETRENAIDLADDLQFLGKYCMESGMIQRAKEVFQERLRYVGKFAACLSPEEYNRNLLFSYLWLGDVCKEQERLSEAWDWYKKSLEIDEALAEKTGTVLARRDLSVCYCCLGDVSEAQGRSSDAWDWYMRALKVRETLAEETGTVRARRDLSMIYVSFGSIHLTRSIYPKAEVWYKKALEIFETLAEKTGTVVARRDLSSCYFALGAVSRRLKRFSEAREWLERSLGIYEALAEETDTANARRDLFIIYNELGLLNKDQGRFSEAEEWHKRALVIAERLAEETETVDARRNLSGCYLSLGDLKRDQLYYFEAQEWYKKSLEIIEARAEEMGTVQALRDLAYCYRRMRKLSAKQGLMQEEMDWQEKMIEIDKTLQDRIQPLRYKESLGIFEVRADETTTVEQRRDLLIHFSNVGDTHMAQGRLQDAWYSYKYAAELRESLAEETGTVEALRDLADCYKKMSKLSEKLDLFENRDLFYEVLDLLEKDAKIKRKLEELGYFL